VKSVQEGIKGKAFSRSLLRWVSVTLVK